MTQYNIYVIAMIVQFLVNDYTNALESTNELNALQTIPMMSQVIIGLLFVTTMIFALAWLAKKLGAGAILQQKNMKVSASLMLGTREKAVLLEVEGKKILLGVCSNQVSCLHVFDQEYTFAEDSHHTSSHTSSHITSMGADEKYPGHERNVVNIPTGDLEKSTSETPKAERIGSYPLGFSHYFKSIVNKACGNGS
ncbi:flagellar biosynthetic protein FliO [Agarilytica rhodophyticola]|uniref:flagellar biosynthetic protein FliO n=1 Tax=Agarilytica rhodophyticola TaxID=1737490 RepID=UPI000B34521C|nr:flagellar biosynthetic protein FliO [Agarilytica rhodophyticola]